MKIRLPDRFWSGHMSHGGRRKFWRDLTLLVVALALAILGIILVQGRMETRDLSKKLISQATVDVDEEFHSHFDSVVRWLLVAGKWGASGGLDPMDVTGMNAKFIPILEERPQIDGVLIAESDGAGYLLHREGQGWVTRSTEAGGESGRVLCKQWDTDGQLLRSWSEASDFNPLTRPWYRGATEMKASGEIHWTEPYTFAFSNEIGVTASAAYSRKGPAGKTAVVGFDLLMDEIFRFVNSLSVSRHGRAFLFTEQGFVPDAVMKANRPGDHGQVPSDAGPTSDRDALVIGKAIEAWRNRGSRPAEAFDFLEAGERWWAGFRRLSWDTWGMWIGAVVPEKDLAGDIRRNEYFTIILAVLVLVLGIVLVVFFIRKYGRDLRGTSGGAVPSDPRERHVLLMVEQGESATVEFKSTMRMNLKSGKVGKEIELAWLKTVTAFMNTQGGTLLIGVGDHGEIVGIEMDGFESDDKCRLHFKNLIHQHIGVEFSRHLRLQIVSVRGQRVVCVECRKSKKPVFLKAREEEEFFIRSGPSSVKLPVSKVLEYLK